MPVFARWKVNDTLSNDTQVDIRTFAAFEMVNGDEQVVMGRQENGDDLATGTSGNIRARGRSAFAAVALSLTFCLVPGLNTQDNDLRACSTT